MIVRPTLMALNMTVFFLAKFDVLVFLRDVFAGRISIYRRTIRHLMRADERQYRPPYIFQVRNWTQKILHGIGFSSSMDTRQCSISQLSVY